MTADLTMRECGVYAIENLKHPWVYVGATRQAFYQRWSGHCSLLKAGTHHVRRLQEHWSMYGPGWFACVPLEILSPDRVFAPTEQAWIDRMTAQGWQCYNTSPAFEKPRHARPAALPSPILTPAEVALLLKCSMASILAMIHRGELKAFRVRRNWRISRDSLQALVDRADVKEPLC